MESKKWDSKILKKKSEKLFRASNATWGYWGVKCHPKVLGRQMPPHGIGASNATWGCWGVKGHPNVIWASKARGVKGPNSLTASKIRGFKGPYMGKGRKGHNTDRTNVTDFLYLVLHLPCEVTCYFRLFSSDLISVLRTSINVLSKSKSRNYVTWIANLTKLFLSVKASEFRESKFGRQGSRRQRSWASKEMNPLKWICSVVISLPQKRCFLFSVTCHIRIFWTYCERIPELIICYWLLK